MAGTCAACMRPLAKGERFVILETEVLHPRCAREGRPTLLQITRQICADLEVRHATKQRETQNALLKAQQSLNTEMSARALERGWLSSALDARDLEIAKLTDERDAARSSAALYATMASGGESVATRSRQAELIPTSGGESLSPNSGLPHSKVVVGDDTEIRMSLLELDGP